MRYITFLILTLVISLDAHCQFVDVNIRFVDKITKKAVYAELTIDSILYTDYFSNNKVEILLGSHRFIGKSDGQILIDTTINVNTTMSILLPVDIINDGLLWDFKTGFQKVYYDYYNSIAIGLRNDNTFIRKSFFHISLVGCDQYETGYYQILNDSILILTVQNYKCPCAKLTDVSHTYKHVIRNDSIVDISKYVGYIEKKYFGHGMKEFKE